MHEFLPIKDFDDSRTATGQQTRVEDTRDATAGFRKRMLAGPRARYFRSFELVRIPYTPGHTAGNHSLLVHTEQGLWVTSENGVRLDSYAPLQSKVSGIAEYAKTIGSEVIINGNTPENSIDQYISMVQEKTIAGPSARDPRFPNVFPSSEMIGCWLFPGTSPTFHVGEVNFGELWIPDTLPMVTARRGLTVHSMKAANRAG